MEKYIDICGSIFFVMNKYKINNDALIDRFLKYVRINTRSVNRVYKKFPSTNHQLILSGILTDELKAMGLKEVTMNEYGYVISTVPGNIDIKTPVIGFIAHIDTSPDISGRNVKPRFVYNYDGADIQLNPRVVLSVEDFPEIIAYKGQTLIVTDGNTLLGADDKAGIAEIMTAVEFMINNPDFKHGDIRIGFTVDEEVGNGVDHFNVDEFNADFAYTIDGSRIGEIEYENFNAADVIITVHGRNIHPGNANQKMKNAILIGQEYNLKLPADELPENTDGYKGFYHLINFNGTVENTSLQYLIRDHNRELFEVRKQTLINIADNLNEKYGEKTILINITDQYYNMREKIMPIYHIVKNAVKAMETVGVKPLIKPIRGGTDGAKLSFLGLPCPNLFTGGENPHSRYEYIPVKSMFKACETILEIINLYTKN